MQIKQAAAVILSHCQSLAANQICIHTALTEHAIQPLDGKV